jgi:Holliday junction resolvase RusA-like endonuclease
MKNNINNLSKKFQEFSFYSEEKIPGFNEMVTAAKGFGTRKKGKIFNGYTYMKNLWTTKLVETIKKNKISSVDRVYLHMVWIEPNTKRDPDNISSFIKFILDALQKANIIPNDGWANIVGFSHEFIRIPKKRGVTVRIYNEINKG